MVHRLTRLIYHSIDGNDYKAIIQLEITPDIVNLLYFDNQGNGNLVEKVSIRQNNSRPSWSRAPDDSLSLYEKMLRDEKKSGINVDDFNHPNWVKERIIDN